MTLANSNFTPKQRPRAVATSNGQRRAAASAAIQRSFVKAGRRDALLETD